MVPSIRANEPEKLIVIAGQAYAAANHCVPLMDVTCKCY